MKGRQGRKNYEQGKMGEESMKRRRKRGDEERREEGRKKITFNPLEQIA